MRRRITIAALAALALTAGSIGAVAAQASADTPSGAQTNYVTFYGWPDNDPPGAAIAYPTVHNSAGGTGTFDDPITFATDQAEMPIGTKIYYPSLKRYFVMEDDCAECDQDWTGAGHRHIDLWVGGNGGDRNAVLACEDSLTRSSDQVIVNPPADEPVDNRPLFDSGTNTCASP